MDCKMYDDPNDHKQTTRDVVYSLNVNSSNPVTVSF